MPTCPLFSAVHEWTDRHFSRSICLGQAPYYVALLNNGTRTALKATAVSELRKTLANKVWLEKRSCRMATSSKFPHLVHNTYLLHVMASLTKTRELQFGVKMQNKCKPWADWPVCPKISQLNFDKFHPAITTILAKPADQNRGGALQASWSKLCRWQIEQACQEGKPLCERGLATRLHCISNQDGFDAATAEKFTEHWCTVPEVERAG